MHLNVISARVIACISGSSSAASRTVRATDSEKKSGVKDHRFADTLTCVEHHFLGLFLKPQARESPTPATV